jgi:hypothetical protein
MFYKKKRKYKQRRHLYLDVYLQQWRGVADPKCGRGLELQQHDK